MLCFASSLFKNCLLHNQFLLLTVTTSTIHGLPCGAMIKNPPTDARDTGLIPGSGRSLEWEMATHSSILAWEIPGTEEPGGLQSMGSRRAGHAEQAHTHTHTHTHAFNDSWVYSCYFCSFDRLYKALLLFKIYNQTLFNFALSSCSQIRSEKQIPEYNTTVFLR